MSTFTRSKCPVSGCTAGKFANVAIANENPALGGHELFVLQCEHGHIIAPEVLTGLRSLLESQHKLLAKIVEKIEIDV